MNTQKVKGKMLKLLCFPERMENSSVTTAEHCINGSFGHLKSAQWPHFDVPELLLLNFMKQYTNTCQEASQKLHAYF